MPPADRQYMHNSLPTGHVLTCNVATISKHICRHETPMVSKTAGHHPPISFLEARNRPSLLLRNGDAVSDPVRFNIFKTPALRGCGTRNVFL